MSPPTLVVSRVYSFPGLRPLVRTRCDVSRVTPNWRRGEGDGTERSVWVDPNSGRTCGGSNYESPYSDTESPRGKETNTLFLFIGTKDPKGPFLL